MSSPGFSYSVLDQQCMAIICLAGKLANRTQETGSQDYFPIAAHSRIFEGFVNQFIRPKTSVIHQIPLEKRIDLIEEYYREANCFQNYNKQGQQKSLKRMFSIWDNSTTNTPASPHSPEKPVKDSTKKTPTPKKAEPKSLLSTKRRREGSEEHEGEACGSKRTRLVTPKSTSGSKSPSI
ncbi:hypothetical protein CSAL01_05345 [Colletotrichum salicis]|uniref:Uncharacterized protein n=1 Tax=Colletotrichum salicis TaxID=1209931 RepID=A0A135U535_9PEZI|nr:hypothetical protein CSAL01_05345 [Colletotrichum salicis]